MKQSILVVEDDPSLNRRLREVLGSRWSVAGVVTAGLALETLESRHFDLLLLDLHLPDRDGLDLLRELEAKALIGRVVVVTGHGDEERAVEALRLRALDFLSKPIDPAVLVEAVEKALDRDPWVSAPLDTVLSRARRFLHEGEIASAVAELEAARKQHPESPEVVNLLGIAAEFRFDLTAATELYHLADELGPYPPARRNAERLVFRSWKRPGAWSQIDFGTGAEDEDDA